MQFAPVWLIPLALPSPHYNPAAKGLVPGSRTTRGWAAVTQTIAPAAAGNAAAAASDPEEAPTAASNFQLAVGVVHAQGCAQFHKEYVYVRVLGFAYGLGRSFATFD